MEPSAPILKGLEARGDYVQAFADDIVIVFDGNTALMSRDRYRFRVYSGVG